MNFGSMRDVHPSEVPELVPNPIVVRRTGGGHGLEGKGHTYRGDYILVSQASDGVSASARVCHGSVPVDVLSSHGESPARCHNQQQKGSPSKFNATSSSSTNNDYSNVLHRHLIATSPGSPPRQQRPSSASHHHHHPNSYYAQPNHIPPTGSTSMLHFGGGTLLVDLNENGEVYDRNSPSRYNDNNNTRGASTNIMDSRFAPPTNGMTMMRNQQQLQNQNQSRPHSARQASSTQQQQQGNRSMSTARGTNAYNTMTNNNQNGNVTRTTLLRQQQTQQKLAQKAVSAAAAINNTTIVSPRKPITNNNHNHGSFIRSSAQNNNKSIKTKKPAALTPGALRIIQGQLNNGCSVETVIRRQAQQQRDRVYRPRPDRLAEQEAAGGEAKFQEHLLSSLHAAGVSDDHFPGHNFIHPDLPKEAKLENYYSPSRRHKNISTIPFDTPTFGFGVAPPSSSSNAHHDKQPAVDFDPYGLSLLSTLPPLSASTNPYITGRQELRRPHPMTSCPGAIVMHTALGHLRAVGAVPYLLDCQFGVYAVKPKLTEEEKLQLLEDELVFNYLSDDGEETTSDDDDDQNELENNNSEGSKKEKNLMSLSLTKGINKKRTKLAKSGDEIDDFLNSLSPNSGAGRNADESPSSAFRKTAQELLQPLPKNAYEVPAIAHHRRVSTSASKIQEQREKLAEKKKRLQQFDPNETIDSGITICIDGRALSDHPSKVTRPRFRIFTIFCERHPLPGLKSVCRVPYPKPSPHEWNVTDIIICFGWRADVDAEMTSMENLVGDAFFKNSGLKEHAWESTLLERRLVFQFFAPPVDEDYYTGDPKTQVKKRGANLLKEKGSFHRSSGENSGNASVSGMMDYNQQEFSFFGSGHASGSQSQLPDGAKHQPFRVHDFEMSCAHEAGYRIFTWELFSKEFSRAIGEAFLRGV